MSIAQLTKDPRVRVATITFLCFLLGSTGWLAWLYHLAGHADPVAVDALTMVVGYLMQAAGIGLHALASRKRDSSWARRNVQASLVAYVVCMAPATLAPNLVGTLAFGYLANVLCGYAQGYYLLCLSEFVDKQHRGTVFGSAYALATLAGWVFSLVAGGILTRGMPGLLVCGTLAVLSAVAIHRSRLMQPLHVSPTESTGETRAAAHGTDKDAGEKPDSTSITLACAVIVLLSITKNAGFGFPTVDILEGVSLELSRLLYGAGLLLAGLVCDRERRYGVLCCAGALVTPFLMLSLSGAAAPATLMWALNYLLFGFFSVFRAVLFCDLSARTGIRALAGFGLLFGRVGDALGTALNMVLAGTPLLLITVTAVLFAGTLTLFHLMYQRLYATTAEAQPSEQEIFERFAVRHDLSVREREVLRLVLGERSNSEIAAELFVSEATVKFHVRNLLKKTGCKNRREIMALYRQ